MCAEFNVWIQWSCRSKALLTYINILWFEKKNQQNKKINKIKKNQTENVTVLCKDTQLACKDVFVKALISMWFDIFVKDNAKQMLFVPPIHTVHAHMFYTYTWCNDAIGSSIYSATLQKILSRFESIK